MKNNKMEKTQDESVIGYCMKDIMLQQKMLK